MLLVVLTALFSTCTAISDGFISSSLPNYTVYATCTNNLDLKKENGHSDKNRFNYDAGSYFGDSFVGIPYGAIDYADIYVRSNQKLSYSYSVHISGGSINAVAQNEYHLALGGYKESSEGNVFMYVLSDSGRWSQHSTILPPNSGSTRFGSSLGSVALYNNSLLVGDASNTGAAYLYEFVSNSWSLTSTLANDFSSSGSMGSAVAISDRELAVTIGSAVHIYSCASGVWSHQSLLVGDYTVVEGGYSINPNQLYFHENLLFLSQFIYQISDQYWRAYLFANRSDSWVFESEIVPGDTEAHDYVMGYTFYVTGNTLILASAFDVWEYDIGAYSLPPSDCKTYSDDDGNSGGPDVGMIVGIAVGVGGVLCLCGAWLAYSRCATAGSTKKVKPATENKVDGYLGNDAAGSQQTKTATQTAVPAQEIMYV